MTHNKLTCLFGHHDYSSEEVTTDTAGHSVYLCKICKRSGYWKWSDNVETWFEYDKNENLVHEKWSHGPEYWYDHDDDGNCVHERWDSGTEYWFSENGDIIHTKDPGGYERWKNNEGRWVKKKPKNWKYNEK